MCARVIVLYLIFFCHACPAAFHAKQINIARPYDRSGIDLVPYVDVLYKVRLEKCLRKVKRLHHSLLRALCIDILNPD